MERVKGMADRCGLGKATVITALREAVGRGLYSVRGMGLGQWCKEASLASYPVPKHLEAVRHSIDVMGLPSLKYNESNAETIEG